MAKNEFEYPRFNGSTPPGDFIWPKLRTPDDKYENYSVDLRLRGEDARVFADLWETKAEEGFQAAKRELQSRVDNAKSVKAAKAAEAKLEAVQKKGPSFYAEEDEDGNETGATIFRFRLKAYREKKMPDGTKKKIPNSVKVVDRQLRELPPEIEPWGGTIGEVGFFANGYYFAGQDQAGCSFRLQAVKIHELVQAGEVAAGSFFTREDDEDFDSNEWVEEEQEDAGEADEF